MKSKKTNTYPRVGNYWVIVLAHNEAQFLDHLLSKLKKITPNIIVVNDGSSDATPVIAARYTPYVLNHPVNVGKGSAMKTGSEFAFYKINASAIIFMDGDGQHSPSDLSSFIKLLNQGDSLIFGCRDLAVNMPLWRSLGNKLSSFLVFCFFGTHIKDIPNGYKAMTAETYEKLKWKSSDYGVELEIACKTAKNKIQFSQAATQTIYLATDRGMSLLDILKMTYKILLWRINL